MAYSGVYVFGDSLVDAGNALKLAQFYGDLTFSDLPDGAPTAELGYYQGRFTNGYTFADLLANKTIGTVTKPIFPYGYEDPWMGIPIAPLASDPSGNNLNFAYGGAQIRRGDEAVPDLDGQTDAFKDAVDDRADPNALYLVTIGGNDVRNLAPSSRPPVSDAEAKAALDAAATKYLTEISQLVALGAKHIVITGVPNVGLIPKYDRQEPGELGYNTLDAEEAARSAAATRFSEYLDAAIRNVVVDGLIKLGATVTYVPLMDYKVGTQVIPGALTANLPMIAELNDMTTAELTGNWLANRDLVFFDAIHPNGQANALLGAYMYAKVTGTPWIEMAPLSGPEMNFTVKGVISVVGEVDKTVVSLIAGTTYTVELLGMSSLGLAGSIGDGSLSILNPSGLALTQFAALSGNDSGAGFDARFTFTAPTNGNYTFAISGVGTLTGSYTIQAGVVDAALTPQNNSYTITSAGVGVIEGVGGGKDTVQASVSYALSPGSEIEVLTTTNPKGKTAINLTGNEFGQDIVGNVGANVLEGKGGADKFTGGAGKDVFVLSKAAVEQPGPANIDTITDYASGDVVDITQILQLGSAVNVLAGGWLRVTTPTAPNTLGKVQVDLDGDGDEWVTLSMINPGTGAVAVRYLVNGVVTNVSVNRVAETQMTALSSASTNTVLLSAVAGAGLISAPLAAESGGSANSQSRITVDSSVVSGGSHRDGIQLGDGFRSALTGETRESLGEAVAAYAQTISGPNAQRGASDSDSLAGSKAPAASMAELLQGTDAPMPGQSAIAASLVAEAVVMAPADMGMRVAEGAQQNAEVARVLADTLSGGGEVIDNLLAAVTGNTPAAAQELAAAPAAPADFGHSAQFSAVAAFGMEMMVVHPDSAPLA